MEKEFKECMGFVECFWKKRKVFSKTRAKILRRDLEMALDRHVKNLQLCKLNSIKAVINSGNILEDKLLKLKGEIETQSPEEIGGDYGWLMTRLPSQLSHIKEFNEFAQSIAWEEFNEDAVTERMILNIDQFGLQFNTEQDLIGKEINMIALLEVMMRKRYNHIQYNNGFIIQ